MVKLRIIIKDSQFYTRNTINRDNNCYILHQNRSIIGQPIWNMNQMEMKENKIKTTATTIRYQIK